MPMTEKDFEIKRLRDGSFRVARIDIEGNLHTHLKSRRLAKNIIQNICNGKIPLNSRNYTLESMYRLSDDDFYKNKIKEILDSRTRKGKRQEYYNPGRKKSGGNF